MQASQSVLEMRRRVIGRVRAAALGTLCIWARGRALL